jgi:hypothetical protein
MTARLFQLVILTLLLTAIPTRMTGEQDWAIIRTDDKRFHYTAAKRNLDRVETTLDSFRRLTRLVFERSDLKRKHHSSPGRIPDEVQIFITVTGKDLKSFGYDLNAGVQNIGHRNKLTALRGYFFKSEMEKAALNLEVSKLSGASDANVQALTQLLSLRKQESFLTTSKWSD